MVHFVKDDLTKWKVEEIEDVIIALSAEAHLPEQADIDRRDKDRIASGVALIKDDERCAGCHQFHDAGSGGDAPDLTGYGSASGCWRSSPIRRPTASMARGTTACRPFRRTSPVRTQNQLSPEALRLVADWLRHDWKRPGAEKALPAAAE